MIQNQANIDKETENNEWWKNAFNDMFTVSSGDIKQYLDDFTENTGLENFGGITIQESILRTLEGEPQDFVISWNSVAYTTDGTSITIIPSGDINFSKTTRENDALNNTMTTTRVIIGYTLIILMISNIWKTLMITLGVGVQLYNDNEEEKARLETVESTTDYINGDTGEVTREMKFYHPKDRHTTRIRYGNYGGKKK